jgi:hypothetical protein
MSQGSEKGNGRRTFFALDSSKTAIGNARQENQDCDNLPRARPIVKRLNDRETKLCRFIEYATCRHQALTFILPIYAHIGRMRSQFLRRTRQEQG